MPRDLKEEYQHVLGDLRLNSFKNLSFDTRMKLAIVKRKIALLLTGIVGMERCEWLCRLVPRSLIYISYGGLLMSLEGEMKHIDKVKYGDRVYCLIRTIK